MTSTESLNKTEQRCSEHPIFLAIGDGSDSLDEQNIEQLRTILRCSKSRHKTAGKIPTFPTTGDTPLHYAARFGRCKAFEMLLDDENAGLYRLHINAPNSRRETALMLAASVDDEQHAAIVHAIMTLGATGPTEDLMKARPKNFLVDLNCRDCDQHTALDIAALNGRTQILRALLQENLSETTKVLFPLPTILSAFRVAVQAGQKIAVECIMNLLDVQFLEQCADSVRLLMLSRISPPPVAARIENSEIYKRLLPMLQDHLKFRRQCQHTLSTESNSNNGILQPESSKDELSTKNSEESAATDRTSDASRLKPSDEQLKLPDARVQILVNKIDVVRAEREGDRTELLSISIEKFTT